MCTSLFAHDDFGVGEPAWLSACFCWAIAAPGKNIKLENIVYFQIALRRGVILRVVNDRNLASALFVTFSIFERMNSSETAVEDRFRISASQNFSSDQEGL